MSNTPPRMTSEALQMEDGGNVQLYVDPTNNVQEDGEVQPVDPDDENAKAAGNVAATQNGVNFMEIGFGFQIMFSHRIFYHLVFLAKDDGGTLKCYFTIVETIVKPVVLLFAPLKFPFLKTDRESEGNRSALLHVGDDTNVPIIPVDPQDQKAIEAANLAATQNGVKFIEIGFGFQIMFSHGAFYHLVFLAKDDEDKLKCYFTIVETIFKPVVLLFAPLKFPFLQTDGESEGNRSALLNAGDDRNVPIIPVYPEDQKAKEAAELAATQNGVDFFAVVSGFKIILSHGEFYYLVFSADKEYSELYFTIVETLFKPVVLLFKQMERSSLETIPIQSGNEEPGRGGQ